jgi:hypothetical protein
MLQMDSRREVLGPSSGIEVVGDVVRGARDFKDVFAEAREVATRPGMVMCVAPGKDKVMMLPDVVDSRGRHMLE